MTKVKITSDKNEHRASPALTHLERSPSLAFLLTLNLTMTLDSLQTGLESSKKLQLTNGKKKTENGRKATRVYQGDFNKTTTTCDPGPEKRQWQNFNQIR